jgi:hypothetical protein
MECTFVVAYSCPKCKRSTVLNVGENGDYSKMYQQGYNVVTCTACKKVYVLHVDVISAVKVYDLKECES